jgi:hypothetical protein
VIACAIASMLSLLGVLGAFSLLVEFGSLHRRPRVCLPWSEEEHWPNGCLVQMFQDFALAPAIADTSPGHQRIFSILMGRSRTRLPVA